METALLTGLFELGSELGTAVDLHGANRKRHAVLQSVEELRGGLSGGAGVRLQHVPAGNHIAGGELFEDHAGNGAIVPDLEPRESGSVREWVVLEDSERMVCRPDL